MAAGGSEVGPVRFATYTAPTNIAVVKYWGKRDTALNLPINSSLSVSLDQKDLRTKTTVVASPAFDKDRLWLNGREEDISTSKRVQTVLREIRARAGTRTDGPSLSKEAWSAYKVHIVSINSFPTAAGLASSAAGYACLTATLADVFAVGESYPGELTTIARQGSGSASRSLMGGFVAWRMGSKADGSDSLAECVAPETHWPELRVLICVVSDKKKDTGSTEGMTTSVATSQFLAHRRGLVDGRMEVMERAVRERDFATFAEHTMRDSNQFHATCLDTYPPIFYMNDVSKRIIQVLHRLNRAAGATLAGYTFDAGPNAVIYTLADHAPVVLATILRHFAPPADDAEAAAGFVADSELAALAARAEVPADADCRPEDAAVGAVRKIYATRAGPGPIKRDDADALADLASGHPL